jgi:hypothetical protein
MPGGATGKTRFNFSWLRKDTIMFMFGKNLFEFFEVLLAVLFRPIFSVGKKNVKIRRGGGSGQK